MRSNLLLLAPHATAQQSVRLLLLLLLHQQQQQQRWHQAAEQNTLQQQLQTVPDSRTLKLAPGLKLAREGEGGWGCQTEIWAAEHCWANQLG